MQQCRRYQFIPGDQTTNNKMKSFIAAATILATAAAAPQGYHPAPVHAAHPVDISPKPYAYEYGVEDSYSGAAFGAAETSDAKVVTGNYRVALPDGRTQIVTYNVEDGYSGYVADVRYEGQATYPEYKPTYKAAPAYKPAPYHPAPVYHA